MIAAAAANGDILIMLLASFARVICRESSRSRRSQTRFPGPP
jgi:hypothetical protein